jgi:hypothetical protein
MSRLRNAVPPHKNVVRPDATPTKKWRSPRWSDVICGVVKKMSIRKPITPTVSTTASVALTADSQAGVDVEPRAFSVPCPMLRSSSPSLVGS